MNAAFRLAWLTEQDPRRLEALWAVADDVRRRCVGDAVHLRGLIEFSNRCNRNCLYCGLRRGRGTGRYRMTAEDILQCARTGNAVGLGTVVLQSGEDAAMPADWLARVIERLKAETPMAVTLSVGERPTADYALWRRAGADRYLLRFETSNPDLYRRIHPHATAGLTGRLEALENLRDLGYEIGSGVMVGIPGQTYADLAADIELFQRLGLHMVGVGPFIAHPATPLGKAVEAERTVQDVPNTELMASKVLALTRLACPRANLPATTAMETLNRSEGRRHGLQRGANVVMPNLTPARCKALYEIYPAKAGVDTPVDESIADLKRILDAIGRTVGTGRGDSPALCRPAGHTVSEVMTCP